MLSAVSNRTCWSSRAGRHHQEDDVPQPVKELAGEEGVNGATTVTAVMIAASGIPREAAAFWIRALGVGATVVMPVDTSAGVPRPAESVLPDITAIA